MSDICVPEDTDWSCRFPTEDDLNEYREKDEGAGGQRIDKAEALAWSLLASLTMYRIGTCPVTVRPCAARCAPSGSYRAALTGRGHSQALPVGVIGQWSPYISGGVWLNACGCRRSDDCSCSALSEVILPGPVGKITSIKIGGEELSRDAWRVDNGDRLVRLDGEKWPVCQDMASADGEFTVTYYRGAAPNIMTRAAAGALACEFLLHLEGNECRLPSNITRATRAGESYDFSRDDFGEGDTSIPEVNAVIQIYNPSGLRSPVIIASPETVGVRTPTVFRR